MKPTLPADPEITLPDPDTIRVAIDATDERAAFAPPLYSGWALRFRLHLTTTDRLPILDAPQAKEAGLG